MLKYFKNFIKNHIDFKIYNCTWLSIIVAIMVIPCVLFLPQHFGYENGLLENIQMLTLFIGLILAIKAKINKQFFYFVAMVIGILVIREVNCGRTLFFPIPGEVNAYYSWKDIKYGWLAHPIYGIYMAYVAFYFFKNKLFINLLNYIKKVKLPIWNIVLMITGMGLGLYAEKVMENFVFEEISELLFYVSLVGIIYLYAYNKNFEISE